MNNNLSKVNKLEGDANTLLASPSNLLGSPNILFTFVNLKDFAEIKTEKGIVMKKVVRG